MSYTKIKGHNRDTSRSLAQEPWRGTIPLEGRGNGIGGWSGFAIERLLPYLLAREESLQRSAHNAVKGREIAAAIVEIPMTNDETLADLSRRIGAPYDSIRSVLQKHAPEFLDTLRGRRKESLSRLSKWGAVMSHLEQNGRGKIPIPLGVSSEKLRNNLMSVVHQHRTLSQWHWRSRVSKRHLTVWRCGRWAGLPSDDIVVPEIRETPRQMLNKGENLKRVTAALLAGNSIRSTMKIAGVSKQTANKMQRLLRAKGKLPTCQCGKSVTHRGWCKTRLARSPARQATMRQLHCKQRESHE